jgi:hypothetical protein
VFLFIYCVNVRFKENMGLFFFLVGSGAMVGVALFFPDSIVFLPYTLDSVC